jgi:Zn-dependent metalloprotease
VGTDGRTEVSDGRVAVPASLDVAPKVAVAAARSKANTTAKARGLAAGTPTLAVLPGTTPKLVWSVVSRGPSDARQVLVDATSGAVLKDASLARHVDGKGQVFDPNPVVALQNESLTDGNDKDSAVPTKAYKTVTLTDLDGSGYLHGKYATIALPKGQQAQSSTNTFVYTRSNKKFEQVEAYHAVTSVQRYIQSLGFTNVNNSAQKLLPDAVTDDNSWYDPSADTITFGTGGVDDAEDVEVIWHEYGHAVQDDVVPGFGSSEQAGSIGEGWGDYLALTMSQADSPDSKTTPWACLMDWDSTSYTTDVPHCIRRADTPKTTDDIEGEVHADGEIWSHALYDINKSLGRDKANKVIIEGTFKYKPDTSFADAAKATVAAAQQLYGTSAANACTTAFKARKIL